VTAERSNPTSVGGTTRGTPETSVHRSVRHDKLDGMSSETATRGDRRDRVTGNGPAASGSTAPRGSVPLWRDHRVLWLYEVALILFGYWLYSYIRNAVHTEESTAVNRGHDIVSLERTLHIFHEQSVNAWVAGQHWLAYVCNYYYATLHFVVTIAVGVWVYRKRPWYARRLRNAWYLMTLYALVGFAFFALAPPRLLPGGGFIDTVVKFHTWGSWGDGSVASHSNQYAAMPSMHIGWSLWCGLVLWHLAKHRWVRILGMLYPLATLFVIIGTGNHYFADAIGGVIACALGFGTQRLFSRRAAFAPPPPELDGASQTEQVRASTA
jgi:hypothetical protein